MRPEDMTLKAVLFDLDNTLMDFINMKRESTRAAAYAMVNAGLKADRDELAGKLFEFYLRNGIESDDAFMKYLIEQFGVVDYRMLAAAVNAYLKEKANYLKPYPDVVETLKELKKKGLKLGVVSDGARLKAWMRLNAAGLDRYFDVVVTFEDTGREKPASEPFKKAINALRVRPEESLMVGDWPEKDVEGAKKVGIKTCWVKHGKNEVNVSKANYEVDSIKELLGII